VLLRRHYADIDKVEAVNTAVDSHVIARGVYGVAGDVAGDAAGAPMGVLH
jgi:hypothetical protein